jgi:uncharacterized DUF497 family protein
VYEYAYKETMRFIWDERKRKANIKKHAIDFADALKDFAGPTFTLDSGGK